MESPLTKRCIDDLSASLNAQREVVIDVKSGCSSLGGCVRQEYKRGAKFPVRVEILTSSKRGKTAGGERVREE